MSHNSREHTGGCLCGAVSYLAQGEPAEVTHCFCSMCRRHSGGAAQTFAWFEDTKVELTGQVRLYRSSEFAQRGFCETCGSSVLLDYDEQPGTVWLTVGTFDEPGALTPTVNWCTTDKPWWTLVDDDLAHGGD